MYDPKIARFMQEDTYTGDPNDPLSLNLYTYCHNEPIRYTDPTGDTEAIDYTLHSNGIMSDKDFEKIQYLTHLFNTTTDKAKKTLHRQMSVSIRKLYMPQYIDKYDYTFGGTYSFNGNMQLLMSINKDVENATKYSSNDVYNPIVGLSTMEDFKWNISPNTAKGLVFFNNIADYANAAYTSGIIEKYERDATILFAKNSLDKVRNPSKYEKDEDFLAFLVGDVGVGFLLGLEGFSGEISYAGDMTSIAPSVINKISSSPKLSVIESTMIKSGISKLSDFRDIRAYRGVDISTLADVYKANPKYVIEMPFVGEGRKVNSQGWERNFKNFCKRSIEQNPEIWSDANKALIKAGKEPVIDKQMVKYLPQFKNYLNEPFIHHHIGGGGQATIMPRKLHSGSGGVHMAEKALGLRAAEEANAATLKAIKSKTGRTILWKVLRRLI